jgi:hypothetical protein
MATANQIVTEIALGLTSRLHIEQLALFRSRYVTSTDTSILKVTGTTAPLELSDILPFHPLFVASVKLEYTVPSQTPEEMGTNSDIRVIVELRSDNLT